MRKLFYTAFFVLFYLTSNACEIKAGKFTVEHTGGSKYKIYMVEQPKFTCWQLDSIKVRFNVFCKESGQTAQTWINTRDTLEIELGGKVVIAAETFWFYGTQKSRTDMHPVHMEGQHPNNCFYLVAITQPTTQPNTPTPPAVVPQIGAQNGAIVSNTGGTLILSDYPNFTAIIVKDYQDAFSYSLTSGWWYYYLILPDGSTIGNQVIQVP